MSACSTIGRPARAALLELLAEDAALTVGDQLPYAVDDEHDYTLPVHGEQRGLLHSGSRSGRT